MGYSKGQVLGVDFTKTYTDGNFDYTPGQTLEDSAGTTFMFVRHTAAKTAGYAGIIDQNFTFGSVVTTSLTSAAPLALGVPQVDIEAPDSGQTYSYSWVAVKGPMNVIGVNGCSADVELYTTSVGGTLNSLVSGNKKVFGLKFTTAVTAASTATAAYASSFVTVPDDL